MSSTYPPRGPRSSLTSWTRPRGGCSSFGSGSPSSPISGGAWLSSVSVSSRWARSWHASPSAWPSRGFGSWWVFSSFWAGSGSSWASVTAWCPLSRSWRASRFCSTRCAGRPLRHWFVPRTVPVAPVVAAVLVVATATTVSWSCGRGGKIYSPTKGKYHGGSAPSPFWRHHVRAGRDVRGECGPSAGRHRPCARRCDPGARGRTRTHRSVARGPRTWQAPLHPGLGVGGPRLGRDGEGAGASGAKHAPAAHAHQGGAVRDIRAG